MEKKDLTIKDQLTQLMPIIIEHGRRLDKINNFHERSLKLEFNVEAINNHFEDFKRAFDEFRKTKFVVFDDPAYYHKHKNNHDDNKMSMTHKFIVITLAGLNVIQWIMPYLKIYFSS